jgi:4-hydroxy-2-oxoglutarate aldolase
MEPFEFHRNLSRVFVPITTPFAQDEEIDYRALESNLEFFAGAGLTGFSALGSSAENMSLTDVEKLSVLKVIAAHKRRQDVLIVCAACEAQRDAERFLRQAVDLGADLGRLACPSHFREQMTDEVLYRYFTTIADTSPIPILLYNAPKFCGFALSPDLVRRLSDHPGIVGIKDSAEGGVDAFLALAGERFLVLAGSVRSLFPAMINGAVGGTVSLANAFPDLVGKLFEYGAARDLVRGFPLHEKATRISKAVSGVHGVPGLKAAMSLMGLDAGIPRRPLLPLTEEQCDALKQFLLKEQVLSQDRHRSQ